MEERISHKKDNTLTEQEKVAVPPNSETFCKRCSLPKVYQQIISSAATGATFLQETATSSTSQLSSMPSFSPTALRALSVEQLREICRTYNIKQGKKKEDFVQTISARSATVHTQRSAVEKVLEDIRQPPTPDPSPFHDLYRESFNLVDLLDRRWYSVEEHHGHQSWKGKMILAILRFAMINTWTYCVNFEFENWLEWRENVFQSLMGI